MLKIAIFPDSLTHYRVPVFNSLASIKGVQIDVYATNGSRLPDMQAGLPEDCRFRIIYNQAFFVGRWQVYQTKLLPVIVSGKYDVTIVWGVCWYLSNWLAGLINKVLSRSKLVFWTGCVYGDEVGFKLRWRKWFYRLADAFLLYGERGKELMVNRGIPDDRLYVIYNSLDFDRQDYLYRKYHSLLKEADLAEYFAPSKKRDSPVRYGIYVGRLQKRKKLHQVIEVIPYLKGDHDIDFKILIVGSGNEKPYLRACAEGLGVTDNVAFLEAIYDEEALCKLFLCADVCVTPGDIGLLAMHSLSYGTPVVTHSDIRTHGPEVEAIKKGVNGCLFEPDDVPDLAEKIADAVKLKKKGREFLRSCIVERYNLQNQRRVFVTMLHGLGLRGGDWRE